LAGKLLAKTGTPMINKQPTNGRGVLQKKKQKKKENKQTY